MMFPKSHITKLVAHRRPSSFHGSLLTRISFLIAWKKNAAFSTTTSSKCSSGKERENVTISDDTIKEFKENGVVSIKNIFNPTWVNVAHQGIMKNFKNPSEHCDYLEGEDGEGVYFNDYLNWRKYDEFEKFMFASPAAKIAGLLMQSDVSILFHEHVFVKIKAKGRAAPWHHDQAYYPLNGMQNCTIWMPTTPVSKETCLKFVKGSHLWGKWFHPRKFESHSTYPLQDSKDGTEFEYEDVPDINNDEFEILSWDLEPGDCLAFHMKTLHGTDKSSSLVPRYVLATRWVGDDATFAARPWKSSPPPEILPKNLKLGTKYKDITDFPIVWRK